MTVEKCLMTLKNLESWGSVKTFRHRTEASRVAGLAHEIVLAKSTVYNNTIYLDIKNYENKVFKEGGYAHLTPDEAVELGEALVEFGKGSRKRPSLKFLLDNINKKLRKLG